MRIAEASIQELNDKLDAVTVVGDYVKLDKRGGRFWGCCPFHNEKTPSFTVDPDRKLYYCFGCHRGGTIIDFVMEMDKLTFPEAMELLARKSGVELAHEGGDRGGDGQNRAESSRKDDLFVLYERIAGSFHFLLMEKPEGVLAKRYILDRGIDIPMIERFRLGYAPLDRSWLFRFLSQKGYSPELLMASGLFSRNYPQSAFFQDRLMFPIADRQGRTVAFGGRIREGEGPKYLNSPESEIYRKGQTLFALDLALPEIRNRKAVYLAEGYLDVIALHQAGITNAVAPLGTAFTDDQAKLLRRWADEIYLVFDADAAGQNAAVKGILTGRKNGLAVKVVIPGRGLTAGEGTAASANAGEGGTAENAPKTAGPKDPADILKDFGPELLQKSVKYFINDFEYLIERARIGFDSGTPGGKAQAAAFLFPYALVMDSDVARDACLDTIADAVGVDRDGLRADFRRYTSREGTGNRGGERGADGGAAAEPIRMNDELFLLAAVFINHRLYAKFRSILPIEELEDPKAKELYVALEEWFRNEAPDTFGAVSPGVPGADAVLPGELLSRVRSEALRTFVLGQSAQGAFSRNPENLMIGGAKRIRQKRLDRRRKEIVVEMRTQTGVDNRASNRRSLEDLLAEKVHLDEELKKLQGS
jgi:DNA primase